MLSGDAVNPVRCNASVASLLVGGHWCCFRLPRAISNSSCVVALVMLRAPLRLEEILSSTHWEMTKSNSPLRFTSRAGGYFASSQVTKVFESIWALPRSGWRILRPGGLNLSLSCRVALFHHECREKTR